MPQVTLRGPGNNQAMHWPFDATVYELQARLCSLFRRDFRDTRAIVRMSGRELFAFERPFLFMPRWCAADVEISFARHSWLMGAFLWDARGWDGDISDGCSTNSQVAEAVENLELEMASLGTRRER